MRKYINRIKRVIYGDPKDHLSEVHALLIKTARRCAYDLAHAAGDVRDEEWSKFYHARSQHWLKIFEPDGMKNYRHQLHHDIESLESQNRALVKLLDENNIKHPYGEMPF